MNLEDRERFRSIFDTVESSLSFFNCIGEFHISIDYSNIVFRDLDPILIYFIFAYTSDVTLLIHEPDK